MRLIFWSRPVPTEETHRITCVEIFFDLVFIFAYTRVTAFMGQSHTPTTLVRGLILLLLLRMSWTSYTGWVLRAVDIGLYFYAAAQSGHMRTTLRLFSITTAFAWIPLILGATLGGTAQTLFVGSGGRHRLRRRFPRLQIQRVGAAQSRSFRRTTHPSLGYRAR